MNDGVLEPDEDRMQRIAGQNEELADVPSDPIRAKGETYLELARVELDDEPAIVSFCDRFRTLGVRHNDFAAFRAFPNFDRDVRPGLEAAWGERDDGFGVALNEGLEDFRFGARCVRDLVRASLILSDEDDDSAWEALPAGSQWLDPATVDLFEEHGRQPTRKDEAAEAIHRLTTRALDALAPGLYRLSEGVDPARHGRLWDVLPSATLPLYAVCCVELYNHLVEAATYRRCANESCRNLFVHQDGRAVHGQYRSHGVAYCSFSCAHAQNQRNYRRRRAQRAG